MFLIWIWPRGERERPGPGPGPSGWASQRQDRDRDCIEVNQSSNKATRPVRKRLQYEQRNAAGENPSPERDTAAAQVQDDHRTEPNRTGELAKLRPHVRVSRTFACRHCAIRDKERRKKRKQDKKSESHSIAQQKEDRTHLEFLAMRTRTRSA